MGSTALKTFIRLVASSLLAVGLASPALAADTLHLVTEESPPYNTRIDGKIAGIATDKVVEMMRRAKRPFKLEMLPWARAYKMAFELPQTCVFSTTRTKEREPHFKWVGPLAFNLWVLYGKADRNIHLTDLEDARQYVIGTYNADVRDSFLRDKGFTVDTAPDDALNPVKLRANRIDLWASSPFEAQGAVEDNAYDDRIVPVLTFNRVELYLACHPSVSSRLVDQLNRILVEMENDGTIGAIEQRYGFNSRKN